MGLYTKGAVIWNMYTCEFLHVNKEVLTVSACKGTDICELHTVGLYSKATVIWKMHTCEYLHVHKEVLTVSARKGIDLCEFLHRGFLYKSVHHTIYVYLWVYAVYTKRFEVWALARAQTYVSLHTMGLYTKVSMIWQVYTCEYLHVNKEVLTVSARTGTAICKFPHRRFLYKSVHHTI